MIKVVIAAVIVAGAYCYGYKCASDTYEKMLTEMESENRAKIIEQERAANEKQNEIISNYLNQIEKLKNEKDIIKPSGTINPNRLCKQTSAGVPAKTTTKSNVTCYTDAELQRKIKESLDIGREADELALKYKALVEVCK